MVGIYDFRSGSSAPGSGGPWTLEAVSSSDSLMFSVIEALEGNGKSSWGLEGSFCDDPVLGTLSEPERGTERDAVF